MRAAGGEAFAQLAHARCSNRRRPAHQHEHLLFECGARGDVGLAAIDRTSERNIAPAPVHGPQVGRVHTVGARGFLHGAVLREHRQRRHDLARQHARQVVEQRERGLFKVVDDQGGELVRLGDEALNSGFASTQHGGSSRQADEFECAHALVNLLTRGAQHRRVDGIDVRAGHGLGFLDESAQRFVRSIERATQFVVYPREGTQVV